MQSFRVAVFGVVTVSVAFLACVGDSTTPAAKGELDGPCFTDGSCNPGLVCTPTSGASKCVVGTKDASTNDSATNDAAGDSGPRECTIVPTSYPCPKQGPTTPPACYGESGQGCSVTACPGGPTDIAFQCFGPNQCNNALCCVPKTSAGLTPTPNCTTGALVYVKTDAGPSVAGSECQSAAACSAGDTQLCQFTSQCPKGQVCSPVKVTGIGTGQTINLGACMP